MPFSDIVGHRKQLETLRWSLQKDRLHHAYLFLGPEGVGKKTLALCLAKAVQCPEMAHDFCGRCVNCVRIENRNHPDVQLVGLLPRKQEISIEQVRELERNLNFRAFSGRKKITLVDPASLMNLSAQNALLKTLEEPPRDSLLILISTSAGGLLQTLLSRCLRLSFSPLPQEELARFLISKRQMQPEEAELLAALTMGSLGRALSPDVEGILEKRKAWVQQVISLSREDCREWMSLAEELGGVREESLKFLEWVEGWYRDILIYRVTGKGQGLANLDMLHNIQRQAELHSQERILFLLSQAARTKARLERNVNRRMALENFFAHVVGLR